MKTSAWVSLTLMACLTARAELDKAILLNEARQPAASATLAAGWRERASFRC